MMANQAKRKTGLKIPRSWASSLTWAAAIVGISVIASAAINPLFGRYVHWDWMAGVAPVSFAILAIAYRRRWV